MCWYAQVIERDAAPETVAKVRESLRRELAERMREAASAQALAQARAQAEAHAHSQLEALLAQKAAGMGGLAETPGLHNRMHPVPCMS